MGALDRLRDEIEDVQQYQAALTGRVSKLQSLLGSPRPSVISEAQWVC